MRKITKRRLVEKISECSEQLSPVVTISLLLTYINNETITKFKDGELDIEDVIDRLLSENDLRRYIKQYEITDLIKTKQDL